MLVSVCVRGLHQTNVDVPITSHEVIILSPSAMAHSKVGELYSSEGGRSVNPLRARVWTAACVTALCSTIYLFKAAVPVLSQLPKLGMKGPTKGRRRHLHMSKERVKKRKELPKTASMFYFLCVHFNEEVGNIRSRVGLKRQLTGI